MVISSKKVFKNLSMLTGKNINLSLLEIDKNKDLNKEIRSISNFDRRKDMLKNQKIKYLLIKIYQKRKKNDVKKLDRQLTIDSPFDAIIVASEGDKLLEILSHLAFYDINANNTLIYGTSLWEDTFKTDPVFENTFFVTNLKKRSESFTKKNYQDVFSKNPTSLNFHLFDLIDFVNEFKVYDEYPENKIHVGRFTNSQVKSGSLRRETYIKKNKGKNNTEDISSCRLDII